MKTTGLPITPESLMTLEAYHKFRKTSKADVIAHRKLRSIHLGEHINMQFESELSIRYQIQEMLRIEKSLKKKRLRKRSTSTRRSCPQARTGRQP